MSRPALKLLGVCWEIITDTQNQVRKTMKEMEVEVDILDWLKTPAGEVALRRALESMVSAYRESGMSSRTPTPRVNPSILRLLSGGEEIIVSECDGTETLGQAKDVFTWGISEDFQNLGLDILGEATQPTSAAVYELVKNATFRQMFESVNADLNQLCWTQAQIKRFVRDHANWLDDNWYTLFLFKVGDQFFVAGVDVVVLGKLHLIVRRFLDLTVWSAGDRARVVVPQPIL